MQIVVFLLGPKIRVIVQDGVDATPNQVIEALGLDRLDDENTSLSALSRRAKDFEAEFLRRSAEVKVLIPSFEDSYKAAPKDDEWWDYIEDRPFHFPTWLVVRGGTPSFDE